jgi:hypothetical protein
LPFNSQAHHDFLKELTGKTIKFNLAVFTTLSAEDIEQDLYTA